jgi:CRISPR/Cas system type I-B associated protein Csh2 (Cas7 group RAMP superfamily)
MSAGERAQGGAMGMTRILDYSLISFSGVVCPHTAKIVQMTVEDLEKLYKSLWWGTKTLNTRSKFNHIPRLLIILESNDQDYSIGNLANTLVNDPSAPNTVEFKHFINRIKTCLNQHAGIKGISYCIDPDLPLYLEGTRCDDLKSLVESSGIDVPISAFTIDP